jgi:PKD repeat protein
MKKIFTLFALAAFAFSATRAQTCDTIFNLNSPADLPATLITVDAGGYLSGNNGYGDSAKAEGFNVPDSATYLTSAALDFGYVTINPTDTNNTVTIYAWDNTGYGGGPGNIIDQATVTMGNIAQAVSDGKWLEVYFSGDSLTTSTIYVGLYLPTNPGDTLALLTNPYAGPDGNGWELTVLYGWSTYSADWNDSVGSLGNYINITVCSSPPADSPTAAFVIDGATTGCSALTVSFTDQTDTNLYANSWTWLFGDGGTSNQQNPTYTYATGGTYSVTELVATDTGVLAQVFYPAAPQTVTVVASPSLSITVLNPDTASAGLGNAVLSVTSATGYYHITWSNGDFGDTLADVTAGFYSVHVLDQNGCPANDTVTIPNYSAAGILPIGANKVNIYPNPATDVLNLVWSKLSNAEVSVIDMNGNVMSTILTSGDTKTLYDIRNLAAGPYILRITDRTTQQQQSMVFTKF